jgi:hypothetical protein
MREMSAVVFTHVSPRSTRRGGDDGRSLPRPSLPVLSRTLLAERDAYGCPQHVEAETDGERREDSAEPLGDAMLSVCLC